MPTITINPVSGDDILASLVEAGNLQYSGTETGLDGATLTFVYQIWYGDSRIPWPGANPTVAENGTWITPVTGYSYTAASPDGVYAITASGPPALGGFGQRTLIQATHDHTAFESVGLAFDGESAKLANTPTHYEIRSFISAEQAGIGILQQDHIINKGQANKLQGLFDRELQALGSSNTNDLLNVGEITTLMGLQTDIAAYVEKTPSLSALQPHDAGWTMPAMPTS
jgi:hypothetical protein